MRWYCISYFHRTNKPVQSAKF